MNKKKTFFATELLHWYKPQDRPLPWKGINDPYRIWLSEIILQQTRVDQGLPYYQKFVAHFPHVEDLAKAEEDEVLKLWQGLGYYSRARNLHATAKMIVNDFDGQFPTTYKGLLQLKGVGPYTAAAIASFAYQLPHAVVDGNVYRVLARYFGINSPIDKSAAKKRFQKIANELLAQDAPATYNQAIMDFGATVCTPKKAACDNCPLNTKCTAYANDKVYALPRKSKRIKHRKRYFYYLVIRTPKGIYLRQRGADDIWKKLYDFPLIETDRLYKRATIIDQLSKTEEWQQWFGQAPLDVQKISKLYKQTLSHQKISTFFIEVFYKGDLEVVFHQEKNKLTLTNQKKLQTFAFPKMIAEYLSESEN